MRKFCIFGLVIGLTCLLFTGCRDMTGSTTAGSATSAATQSTAIPSPDITLPMDTTAPNGTGGTVRGPRY